MTSSSLLLLLVVLIVQCTCARDLLPAPVNVSMVSVDFRHQLNWDPGPGTPPGARYNVSTRKLSDNHTRWKVYKKTSCLLKLDNLSRYSVSVHAFYNLSLVSPESMAIVFSPYKDTNISAPWLSLVGGDHHLKLNISLARAKKINIQALYGSIYRIYWKKAGGRKDTFIDTENSSVVLGNLEVGVEYCVQVHIMNRVNPNTQPSRWMCASTSDPEPSKVPTVLGITVPILVLVVGGMALFMVILHYIGYLCKIKDRLPDILLVSFGRSSLLTPETTVLGRVYLNPEVDKQKGRRALLQSAVDETEDDDDEDEGENAYLNRAAELSSDSDSQDARGDSSGNYCTRTNPSVDRVVLVGKVPLPGSHGQPEVRGHSVKGPVMPQGDPNGIVGSAVSEEEEEVKGVSVVSSWQEGGEEEEEESDVNLFSVTLGKEENSGNINLCPEIFGENKEVDVEYPPRGSLTPLHDSSPASQSGMPSDTPVELLAPSLDPGPSHGGEAGYKGRKVVGTSGGYLISHGFETDNEEEEEEEEEEEDYSSGYLG